MLLIAEDLLGEGRNQLQKGYSPFCSYYAFLWQYALLKKLAIQLQQELQ